MKLISFLVFVLIHMNGIKAIKELTSIELNLNISQNISFSRKILIELKKIQKNKEICKRDDEILFREECLIFGINSPQFCNDDEVIIFEKPKDVKLQGKFTLKIFCKQLECNRSQIWWPSANKCVSFEESTFCGEQAYMSRNIFGEGICKCVEFSGRLSEGGKCYQYYQKGPCGDNEVFVYDPVTTLGKCTLDLCLKNNEEYEQTEKTVNRVILDINPNRKFNEIQKIFAPLNGSGPCYELGSISHCNGLAFQLDPDSNIPTCPEINLVYRGPAIGAIRCPGNYQICDKPIKFGKQNKKTLKDRLKDEGFD